MEPVIASKELSVLAAECGYKPSRLIPLETLFYRLLDKKNYETPPPRLTTASHRKTLEELANDDNYVYAPTLHELHMFALNDQNIFVEIILEQESKFIVSLTSTREDVSYCNILDEVFDSYSVALEFGLTMFFQDWKTIKMFMGKNPNDISLKDENEILVKELAKFLHEHRYLPQDTYNFLEFSGLSYDTVKSIVEEMEELKEEEE